uniref:Uncharacterized protein n=1 Tax=Oreochromis niloticus TaxID=8128 RepID=A0A669ES82_ORENI
MCRFRLWSESARITLPSANSCVPVFPVFPARSEPARSTRQSLEEWTDLKEEFLVRMVITTSLAPTTTGITQRDFLVNETRLLLPL